MATGVPNRSLSVTSTLASPGSPGSCASLKLASNHTRPATLALSTLGLATMFVTDAVRAIGNWVDVVEAVFVIDVIPEGSGLLTVALKVRVSEPPGGMVQPLVLLRSSGALFVLYEVHPMLTLSMENVSSVASKPLMTRKRTVVFGEA